MGKIGARFGGRIRNKEGRKKKQEKNNSQEYDDSSTTVERERKKEQEERDNTTSNILDKIRESNFIVATLIASATFASIWSVQEGTISTQELQDQSDKVYEILRRLAFHVFVFSDIFSFVLSVSAMLLQTVSALAPSDDEKFKLHLIAQVVTYLSMVLMFSAFEAAIYLVLSNSHVYAGIVILVIETLFITFMCVPLCIYVFRPPPDEDNLLSHGPIWEAEDIL